jgi:hypothetical protein
MAKLLEFFCKDGEKEDIGADLKTLGWTLENPNPRGNQINFLFNNIFEYLNKFNDNMLTNTSDLTQKEVDVLWTNA